MRKTSIDKLGDSFTSHILESVLPGSLYMGGLGFKKPGERSHSNDGADGADAHVHDDCEAFMVLQGKGEFEVNGEMIPIHAGDVVVAEPGEDHHIISSHDDPLVSIWLHASESQKA